MNRTAAGLVVAARGALQAVAGAKNRELSQATGEISAVWPVTALQRGEEVNRSTGGQRPMAARTARWYRYDNGLPLPIVLRLVRAFSNPGEHVVDPFLGGGTTAVAAWLANRRFTGGDVNPHAIRFTAARLLAEHAWPADRQPSLLCE